MSDVGENKMPKRKFEVTSKNYYVRVKATRSEKDGEYYDIVFGLKGQGREHRAHFGIKAMEENGMIGGKYFFREPRQATTHYYEETFNMKTGEKLAELNLPFQKEEEKIGAEIHISTYWDENVKKLFIGKIMIVEKEENSV